MRWMNHKKSRVMDFFRRIDKDQDGKVTRQEFIEGILSSRKAPTRLVHNTHAHTHTHLHAEDTIVTLLFLVDFFPPRVPHQSPGDERGGGHL